MRLWTAEQAAAADRHTIDALGMPSPVLMERAALCVSAQIEALLDAAPATVLVLVGPGNNGGDGLAIARQLHGRGRAVAAVMVTAGHNAAVALQLELARSHGVEIVEGLPEEVPDTPTLVVDALLGTGSRGAPRGSIEVALRWLGVLAGEQLRVVAVDLPSGIDVDTGAVFEPAARVDVTVTFQRSKPGLHLTPAREHVGRLVVADIGLVDADGVDGDQRIELNRIELIEPAWAAACVAGLPSVEHKGRRGHVGIIGGTGGTPGAAILAGSAALRAGAGLVTLAPIDPALRELLIARRPELMLAPPEQAWSIPRASVLVVGPGLVEADVAAIARLAREDRRPMVWDASGLEHHPLGDGVARHVLTPHPGEAARLLARVEPEGGWDGAKVQANRRHAAERLAAATDAVVVLKGAGTIVARRSKHGMQLAICTSGGPALAVAGTGDVLAGTIGALLARGLDAWTAARVGVHLHGCAGDRCPVDGTVAMDVADALPQALMELAVPSRGWPTLVRG